MKNLIGVFTIAAFCLLVGCQSGPVTFYVAPNGSDQFSGRLAAPNAARTDGPFASLQKAQEAVRNCKLTHSLLINGITVCLLEGTYPITTTLQLTQEDSGTSSAPITWRACKKQTVRLTGGKSVSGFRAVEDAAIRSRLDSDIRDHIVQADLKSLGISEYLPFMASGKIGMELFYLGQPMQIARWPNYRYETVSGLTAENRGDIRGRRGRTAGKIILNSKRILRWIGEHDAWVHGFWFWDWSDSYQKISRIDPDTYMIHLENPQHGYGYRQNQRFYGLNILAELDVPGEWYLDRQSGILYFYPPEPLQDNQVAVSLLNLPMITLNNTSHIRIENLIFECSLETPVQITGGEQNRIAGCVFRNLAGNAIAIHGGTRNGVLSCDIYNTGTGGISLSGGDRNTLTPAAQYAVNNYIHHYSRWRKTGATAISTAGVGNRIAHNLIHDAPHMAIGLSGNDHVIEYNDIHHVGLETNDAGAFYMGRNWTQRGNLIRGNFFHDLGTGDFQAIYLDDFTCGTTVVDNICTRTRRGVLVGGGRDNHIENNYFIQCEQGVHIDQRGIDWAKDYFNGIHTTLFDALAEVNGTKPPYSEKYPELAVILEDDPALAKGNQVLRNLFFQCPKPLDLTDGLTMETDYLTFQDNLFFADPQFYSVGRHDFRLPDDSPALKRGIRQIPVEKIGLYPDCFRTLDK